MDFITDNNPKVLSSLVKEASYQEYSKKASKSKQDLEKLSTKAFADVGNREFPINNKANTFMSALYFKRANVQNEAVSKKIDTAVRRFRLESTLDGVLKAATVQKDNKLEDKYAIVVDDTKGYYPINNEYNVEKSAEMILEDKNKIPALVYRTACFSMAKAAKDFGIENRIPKEILEVGANREENFDHFQAGMQKRANSLENTAPVDAAVYLELAGLVKQAHKDNDEDATIRFMEMVNELDSQYGFDKVAHYENCYALLYSGEELETYEKLAKQVVLVDTEQESYTIPLEDFRAPLSKVANTYYTGEDKAAVEALRDVEDASAITIQLRKWSNTKKENLMRQIAQFSN